MYGQLGRTGLGHGRVLSREEAVEKIAKNPRAAMRLLSGYLQRIPERRSR